MKLGKSGEYRRSRQAATWNVDDCHHGGVEFEDGKEKDVMMRVVLLL